MPTNIFKHAIRYTLQNEGGYTLHHDPDDPGGETFAGIARNRHSNWEGWQVVDRYKAGEGIDQGELARLVNEFYYQKFWLPLRPNTLILSITPEELIVLFDFAVNTGVKTAVKALQRIVYFTQEGPLIDGILGVQTYAAIKRYKDIHPDLLPDIVLARIGYYDELVERKPSLSKFYRGWIRRAYRGWESDKLHRLIV